MAQPPFAVTDMVWIETGLVAIGDGGRSASWDEQDDQWTDLPPFPAPPGWLTSLLWTGDEVLLFLAVDGEDTATVGYRLQVGEPAWRPMAPSTQWALNAGQMVWTGREAMGLSHGDRSDSGRIGSAAYDPATDTWRELPGCSMDSSSAVWTGELVLSYGAAFDPATTACLTMPNAPERAGPESTSGREFFAYAWTGSRYLAWSGGTGSDRIYDVDDGVVFTPDSGLEADLGQRLERPVDGSADLDHPEDDEGEDGDDEHGDRGDDEADQGRREGEDGGRGGRADEARGTGRAGGGDGSGGGGHGGQASSGVDLGCPQPRLVDGHRPWPVVDDRHRHLTMSRRRASSAAPRSRRARTRPAAPARRRTPGPG
jgi:hypothetical protein